MDIQKALQNIGQYLSEAVAKIFSPNSDSYPATGAQAYHGDTYDSSEE